MYPVRFVVDCMLGSLARKLRIYGFDTKYDPKIDDETLLSIGLDNGRVLLTLDRSLVKVAIKRKVSAILLNGGNDEDRMVAVFQKLELRINPIDPSEARCPICNGNIIIAEKGMVSNQVSNKLLSEHEVFYVCAKCGKIYWEGGHWILLHSFFDRVERQLHSVTSKE